MREKMTTKEYIEKYGEYWEALIASFFALFYLLLRHNLICQGGPRQR